METELIISGKHVDEGEGLYKLRKGEELVKILQGERWGSPDNLHYDDTTDSVLYSKAERLMKFPKEELLDLGPNYIHDFVKKNGEFIFSTTTENPTGKNFGHNINFKELTTDWNLPYCGGSDIADFEDRFYFVSYKDEKEIRDDKNNLIFNNGLKINYLNSSNRGIIFGDEKGSLFMYNPSKGVSKIEAGKFVGKAYGSKLDNKIYLRGGQSYEDFMKSVRKNEPNKKENLEKIALNENHEIIDKVSIVENQFWNICDVLSIPKEASDKLEMPLSFEEKYQNLNFKIP